jgi:endonuclease YncB( thermonuclease family)
MKKIGAAVLAVATIVGTGLAFRHFVDPYEEIDKVVDGDTFFLKNNRQAVRLYSIDAPELNLCGGLEALARLEKLLSKKKVQLKDPFVDHFGRIVALVYVDGKLINEILLREGVVAYDGHPGSAKEQMYTAYGYAKNNQLGIYSSSCTDNAPPNPKCAIKGDVNERNQKKKYYYPPGCRFYSQVIVEKYFGEDWFCSAKEAIKDGFTLAPGCK